MRRTFFLLVLVSLTASALPLVAAAPPPAALPTSVLRWVDADFDLAQPNLATYQVTGTLLIYRYDVKGKVYDADDLGDAYNGVNKYGDAVGNAFVADIEAAAKDAVLDTLSATFPEAAVTGVTATVDRSTLLTSSGDRYTPAVALDLAATVVRTREAMGLGAFSDEQVSTIFSAGARVTSGFTLSAQTGYLATYAVHPPAGLVFAAATPGTVSTDGRTATFVIDNTQGQGGASEASVTLRDPTATAPAFEDIRNTIDIRLGELAEGATTIPIVTNISADVRAVSVGDRFPGILPPGVRLDHVNADGMRALRQKGVLDDAALAKANEALLASVRENLTSVLGAGVAAAGGLSASDLARAASAPFGSETPVRFVANATGAFALPEGASADQLDTVLRIGGSGTFDLSLFAANGRATTYHLHPPPGAAFTEALGGTVTADGKTATLVVQPGAGPSRLTMRGADAPAFTAEDAKLTVTVDLKDLDVKLGEAAGGDFGDLLIDLTVTGELGVIKLPESVKDGLPSSVSLDHIPSDGIRILVQKGLLSQENLSKLEADLMDQVAQKMGAALGGDIPVTGGFDAATLEANLISTPVSGDEPVVFRAKASLVKPVNGGPVQSQAAMSLYSTSLPLALPRIQGLDTTYTVILPRGLEVSDLQVSGGEYQVGKSPDGRDQFTVTPTSERADITATMSVTPTLVVAKFWPVLLVALLVLVLIVGSPIALVVMRKRGKAKAGAKK